MKKVVVKFGVKVQVEEMLTEKDAVTIEEGIATTPIEEIREDLVVNLADALGVNIKDITLEDYSITVEDVEV